MSGEIRMVSFRVNKWKLAKILDGLMERCHETVVREVERVGALDKIT